MLTFAQEQEQEKDVTKFLGIPVDGYKPAMIEKLKAKGYVYDKEHDCLEGEFNGRDVRLRVATNSNKVWRIIVTDQNYTDEGQIKIRFNNLCQQFENNPKYMTFANESQQLSEKEDISYEMAVHNKQYQANFCQHEKELLINYLLSKISLEEYQALPEEKRIELCNSLSIELTNKSVWFTIHEFRGEYGIAIFYDNGYNEANGEDL